MTLFFLGAWLFWTLLGSLLCYLLCDLRKASLCGVAVTSPGLGLVSLGCCNKGPWLGGFKSITSFPHSSGGWQPSMDGSWWEHSSWDPESLLLTAFSHGRESSLVSLPLLVRTPVGSGSTLIIAFNLNRLLKSPISNTVTWRIKALTWIWGDTIQSIAAQNNCTLIKAR